MWRSKRVLELGAGTGLVVSVQAHMQANRHTHTHAHTQGITLATLGADCTLTDLPHIVPLLQQNVDVNRLACGTTPTVAAFAWGDVPSFSLVPAFDYIFVNECVYRPELIPPLVGAITHP